MDILAQLLNLIVVSLFSGSILFLILVLITPTLFFMFQYLENFRWSLLFIVTFFVTIGGLGVNLIGAIEPSFFSLSLYLITSMVAVTVMKKANWNVTKFLGHIVVNLFYFLFFLTAVSLGIEIIIASMLIFWIYTARLYQFRRFTDLFLSARQAHREKEIRQLRYQLPTSLVEADNNEEDIFTHSDTLDTSLPQQNIQ